MPCGYNGKILRVDLSSKKVAVEEPNENFYRVYLGGRGVGSYYLVKDLKKGIEPLSAENKLIFKQVSSQGPALRQYADTPS